MQPLDSLLVVADRGSHQPALERALDLAERTGATIDVLGFCYDPLCEPDAGLPDSERQALQRRLLAERQQTLQQQLAPLQQRSQVPISLRVVWAKQIARWLCEVMPQHSASLVLKTAHPDRRLFYLPSDWILIRELHRPLWLVHPLQRKHQAIVCATVDAGCKRRSQQQLDVQVLQQAAELARLLGHDLHALYVHPIPTLRFDFDLVEKDRYREQASANGLEALQQRLQLAALPLPCSPQVRVGNPVRSLQSLVRKMKPDLVVVGSKSHNALSALLLGNTVEQLLPHLGTDILVVPLLQDTAEGELT